MRSRARAARGRVDRRRLHTGQPRARARERRGDAGSKPSSSARRRLRRSRIARAVADRSAAAGTERSARRRRGRAWGGAALAALEAWAPDDGAGATSLDRDPRRAAAPRRACVDSDARGTVRQLRVVVQAAAFDAVARRSTATSRHAGGRGLRGRGRRARGDPRCRPRHSRARQPLPGRFIDRVETDGGISDRSGSRSRSTTPQQSSSGSPRGRGRIIRWGRRRWALAHRSACPAGPAAASTAADEGADVRDAIGRLDPDLAELVGSARERTPPVSSVGAARHARTPPPADVGTREGGAARSRSGSASGLTRHGSLPSTPGGRHPLA